MPRWNFLSVAHRFMAKVRILDNGCWEWTGATKGKGYAQFWDGHNRIGAYRFTYELYKGVIPDGLEIDHLCHNRCCVNPEHLEAVTHKENLMRSVVSLTHCPQGHNYSAENTYIKYGGRNCRICARNSSARWRQRQADRNTIKNREVV